MTVVSFAVIQRMESAPSVVQIPPFVRGVQVVTIDLSDWKPVPDSLRTTKVWADVTLTKLNLRRQAASVSAFTHVVGTEADAPSPTMSSAPAASLSFAPGCRRFHNV